jgi:hypothetical protein
MAERPGTEFLEEYLKVADECKGTDGAARALAQVALLGSTFGRMDAAKTAVKTLLADHSQSIEVAPVASVLGKAGMMDKTKIEPTLRGWIEKSPHKEVQSAAMFTLAGRLQKEKRSDAEKAEGLALLEKIEKEYADVKDPQGKAWKEIVGPQLFEMRYLAVGKTPPDFEAVDENGAKFKLSDYRGKVVVLDFWGFW